MSKTINKISGGSRLITGVRSNFEKYLERLTYRKKIIDVISMQTAFKQSPFQKTSWIIKPITD